MTFADEARSRRAHLLRMANTQDGRLRDRLAAYADETPEPPAIGHHGIETTGCPRCQGTMWRQRNDFVCAGCGHVKGAVMECPHCHVEMKPPPAGWFDRHHCPKCRRVAASTDTAEDIETRERQRLEAIALLDAALEEQRHQDKVISDLEQDISNDSS